MLDEHRERGISHEFLTARESNGSTGLSHESNSYRLLNSITTLRHRA